ncbi:MAG: hypothetical protein HY552_03895 [Elusimicrobia bacterium]|nr:hypothetical protein [Elusimicrobiota bacterium]
MTIKKKGSWLIGSVVEGGWNSLVSAAWGTAALALLPVLKRIIIAAWNSPQTPMPLNATWARISLFAVLVIVVSTITLLVIAWRQDMELRKLRKHKCPSLDEYPKMFPGPKFFHEPAEWIPVLYADQQGNRYIQLGDPRCPKCEAPLLELPKTYTASEEWAQCPTPTCTMEQFSFKPSISIIKERARRDAIGKRTRHEIAFPGDPQTDQ